MRQSYHSFLTIGARTTDRHFLRKTNCILDGGENISSASCIAVSPNSQNISSNIFILNPKAHYKILSTFTFTLSQVSLHLSKKNMSGQFT
jgi:hypothetical protein